MPEPRISALVLARDEAANLPECLAALSWVDEIVVVVDAATRDDSEAIARSLADRVVVREFDDFASQRNAALDLATGDWVLAVDADERSSPEMRDEVRRVVRASQHNGYRVPIRSVVLGRAFRYSGTQHDRPLRLFRRDCGRWVGKVHETVDLRGTSGEIAQGLRHRTLPDMKTFLEKMDRYTTLEALRFADEGRPARARDLTLRPVWTFAKLYLGKQGFRDGLEGLMFCGLSGVSVAVRAWKHRELLRAGGSVLTVAHERYVACRCDDLEPRFHDEVGADDPRWTAVIHALGDVAGKRILDLGCGKGRFSRRLIDMGAIVAGVDASSGMLSHARGVDRVRGSASRLPFASSSFDAVIAVEVLEHLPVEGVAKALDEMRRVLGPDGRVAIVDKNLYALDSLRPWLPKVVVKRIDERRGRWMYPHDAPVRERWFRPERLAADLRSRFARVSIQFLLSSAEARHAVFRRLPGTRLMTMWLAQAGRGVSCTR